MDRASALTPLPLLGKLYVTGVLAAGTFAVANALFQIYEHPITYQWVILAGLTLLSGSFTVKLPSIPATISVSDFFVFTSILLFGPAPGTVIVALDGLIISFWRQRKTGAFYRTLFNMAAPAISIWTAAHVFFHLAGVSPPVQISTSVTNILLPLAAFATLYFLLNSWLVAIAVAFEKNLSAARVWRTNFVWLSLNYFGGASIAALLVSFMRDVNLSALGIIVPLWIISYLTFKTSVARVEDANQHLSALNSLYLSTIETLAMAIDAKDQITHGHIRRVQAYAVALARMLGVKDESLVRAIEAAALLHDMGKLAVPEYILNKPGKLTPAEFEKMKLHASVGADILSAIEFPYPVVPIVRHHHENWDGTGYPSGLAGPDIPIGARILSVVDCFDALTSDRPYRPRLSDDDALRILIDRRGEMYDPLVVDTFVKVHAEIVPKDLDLTTHKHVLSEITRSSQHGSDLASSARLDDISASTEEMLALYDLARSLSGQAALADVADVISKHLRRMVPAALCAFFVHDATTDDLVACHASGDGESVIKGLRIPLGERLTGWVGANRQTIVNSDPALDLGDTARTMKPRLRSCLGTPLVVEDTLVGVLTMYSPSPNAFNEDHRRVIEVVAQQISRTVKRSTEFESARLLAFRDALTGLPNLEQLKQFAESEATQGYFSQPFTVVFLDVDQLRVLNERFGRDAGDAALAHVVSATRSTLRGADILFRLGSDEFVVLLTKTDADTAGGIADRISNNLTATQLLVRDGSQLTIRLSIGIATSPTDGTSLTELIGIARARVSLPPEEQPKAHRLPRFVH